MREKQIIRREKVWQEDCMREKFSGERYMGWQIVGKIRDEAKLK